MLSWPDTATWPKPGQAVADRPSRRGDRGRHGHDRTSFYADGGGHQADQGVIGAGNSALIEVTDVQSPRSKGLIVHRSTAATRRGTGARPRYERRTVPRWRAGVGASFRFAAVFPPLPASAGFFFSRYAAS